MQEDLDERTKLKLYLLIVNRYKDIISKQEERSVSEIRQRISPYSETVKKIRDRLIADIQPYESERDFLLAAQRVFAYVRELKTCKFMINFWMTFEEIEELGVAGVMDKALLITALLRSLDSKDARVLVTKSERVFVSFNWKGANHLFVPETGSLLVGDDTARQFKTDPVNYAFSDLLYESYEEG